MILIKMRFKLLVGDSFWVCLTSGGHLVKYLKIKAKDNFRLNKQGKNSNYFLIIAWTVKSK